MEFFLFMYFTAAKKTGRTDLTEKRAPTKVKYLRPICHILRNFSEATQENSLSVLLLVRVLT